MFSTVIQRPGHASHVVEERVDTRYGGTYLWCDCGAWKFQVSKGGCVHVKLAREQRGIEVPAAVIAAALAKPMPVKAAPSKPPFGNFVESQREVAAAADAYRPVQLPIAVELAGKIEAPRGPVDPAGKDWSVLRRTDLAFETKWDGYRMVVEARKGIVRLWSRSQKVINGDWPEIVAAFAWSDGVFDGEVIGLDPSGKHTFNSLQNAGRMSRAERDARIHYVVWDVLEANGMDVHGEAYRERRAMLELALESKIGPFTPAAGGRVILTPSSRDGVAMWNAVAKAGYEGLIAKPLSTPYRYGDRPTWMKLKMIGTEQLVVVGYVTGLSQDGPTDFGSLVLARRLANGRLEYAGKAGTGFTAQGHAEAVAVLRTMHTDVAPWAGQELKMAIREIAPATRTLYWITGRPEAIIESDDRGEGNRPRFPSMKGWAKGHEL